MAAHSRRSVLTVPLGLSATWLLGACGGSSSSKRSAGGASAGNGGPDELFAETASFETLAAQPQRIMAAMVTRDGRVLHGGSVRFTFRPADNAATEAITAEAAFLPVPRSARPPNVATIGGAGDGIGVYSAEGVVLPRPGFWIVTIDIALNRPQRLETAVQAMAMPQVPAPGERAPRTMNATKPTATMPIEAIDSRSGNAGLGMELADPLLHRESISEILGARRPCVVVVSTPTFCSSKFCGPITDVVNDLAAEAQAARKDTGFVHLEVWKSFDENKVNTAAAEWIQSRRAAGNEPWVFLIDRSGIVVRRWDNLVAEAELRQAVQVL